MTKAEWDAKWMDNYERGLCTALEYWEAVSKIGPARRRPPPRRTGRCEDAPCCGCC